MCIFCQCFLCSSRRRHTRCALVTGVQTCALPISARDCCRRPRPLDAFLAGAALAGERRERRQRPHVVAPDLQDLLQLLLGFLIATRSEERRVGTECVSTCRSRWSPYP